MWDIEHSLVNYLLKIIPIVKMTLYHTDILNFRLFTRFSYFFTMLFHLHVNNICHTLMTAFLLRSLLWRGHTTEHLDTCPASGFISAEKKIRNTTMKDITVWKISLYERYPSIKCEGSMYLVWDLVGQFRQNMDIVRVEHSLDHIHRFMLAVHQILVI